MIPSRRWLNLCWFGLAPALLSVFSLWFSALTVLWYALLLALLAADRLAVVPPELLEVERTLPEQMLQAHEYAVSLAVSCRARKNVLLELRDTPDPALHADLPYSFELSLKPRTRQTLHYTLHPETRGDFTVGDVHLRIYGPLKLAGRDARISAQAAVRVYPARKEAEKFTLLARRNRLNQAGIRHARLQGVGREFESLRDYLPDDEMRRVDWKATARRGKLISRQYEVERSQTILLLMDVGRTMLAEIDGVSKLDYSLNAALLLAQVALESEDRVGALVFSDQVQAYVPPDRGRAHLHRLLHTLYPIQASLTESDYRNALGFLQAHYRKRSLVVCFTDLWDPVSARSTIQELALLRPRHLAVAVTLLDTNVLRETACPVENVNDAYRRAVALQALHERQLAVEALADRRVAVVDAPADKVSVALVNRYLQIKEQMLL